MDIPAPSGRLEAATARKLRFLAVQVVGAVAVVHLVVGFTGFVEILANGLLAAYLTDAVFSRPRTLLFTVSGVAVLAGMWATARGRLPLRRAYLLGAAALATYLVGWVAWHTVLNHGLALAGGPAPGGEAGPTHSHAGVVDTLRSHYVDPLLATVGAAGSDTPGSGRTLLGVVSATLEAVGLALLVLLLRSDPGAAPAEGDGEEGGFRAWLGVDRPAVATDEAPEEAGDAEPRSESD